MRRFISSFTLPFLLMVSATLSGCLGYQVGPVPPPYMAGVKTIAVPPFKNETLYPRVEALLSQTVIQQIQQDGTFTVGPERTSDVVLEGTVNNIRRTPARSIRGNVIATSEFELALEIQYKVIRSSNGQVLDQRKVTGTTTYFVGNDLQQDEAQAIPRAAQNAAVRIVNLITEGW